jgi:hypothetical protein
MPAAGEDEPALNICRETSAVDQALEAGVDRGPAGAGGYGDRGVKTARSKPVIRLLTQLRLFPSRSWRYEEQVRQGAQTI